MHKNPIVLDQQPFPLAQSDIDMNQNFLNNISALLCFTLFAQAELHDGTRLVPYDRWKQLKEEDPVNSHSILPIHPSFRIIAIGAPPTEKNNYITDEILCLFHFHLMDEIPEEEEKQLIYGLLGNKISQEILDSLLKLSKFIRNHPEIGISYSLRYHLMQYL